MKISKGVITKGFVLSGIMNIGGVLIFSRFFTNDAITAADPVVISNFGLLMIVVWGLVFLSVSQKYEELNWLVGVFVIEKFLYGLNWINGFLIMISLHCLIKTKWQEFSTLYMV